MSDKILFSILIANYNNGCFFEDCYKSIISQTYKNWEVIIVDDCSEDDSLALIERIVGNDTRFKTYKNTENLGCGYTKRKCIECAMGAILGFLDPEDALYNESLEVMVKAHEKSETAIVSSKYMNMDETLRLSINDSHGCTIPKGKSFLTYGKGAITHFASFKESFYNHTSGINLKLKRAVDQDLYLKLEEVGKHIFINRILYKYRVHDKGISQGANREKAKYWHFKVIVNAFKRRNKMKLSIDNFTKNDMRIFKSKYYLTRLKLACHENRWRIKYYFLFKAFYVYPNHRIRYKIKVFLNYKYC